VYIKKTASKNYAVVVIFKATLDRVTYSHT